MAVLDKNAKTELLTFTHTPQDGTHGPDAAVRYAFPSGSASLVDGEMARMLNKLYELRKDGETFLDMLELILDGKGYDIQITTVVQVADYAKELFPGKSIHILSGDENFRYFRNTLYIDAGLLQQNPREVIAKLDTFRQKISALEKTDA